jgi:hypothetical protein
LDGLQAEGETQEEKSCDEGCAAGGKSVGIVCEEVVADVGVEVNVLCSVWASIA